MLDHGLEQAQRADDVVVVVGERVGARVGDDDRRAHVDDCVGAVFREDAVEEFAVADIADFELNLHVVDVLAEAFSGEESVDNDGSPPDSRKFTDEMSSDVTSTTANENFH